MEKLYVDIKFVHTNALKPSYAIVNDAGFDLATVEPVTIDAWKTMAVRTGICVGIPEGYEVQIRPKSGVSLKTPLMVKNAPGTIDSGYTGEILVILINMSDSPYTIAQGTKIAQAVIAKCYTAEFTEVYEFAETPRGANGFGSTDKN